MYNINATIEARLGSIRFPGKVLKKINKKTFLEFQISRCKKSSLLSNIIVATTNRKEDKKIVKLCKRLKIKYYIGDNTNVLDRITKTHIKNNTDIVVRLCGDNIFQDPNMIDESIKKFMEWNYDIVCYGGPPKIRKIPYGFDIEVLSMSLLKQAHIKAKKKIHLEHPTKYLYDSKKYIVKYLKPKNKKLYASKYTFALDYPEQTIFLKKILSISKNKKLSYENIINFTRKNKTLFRMAEILSKKYVLKRKY